MMTILKIRLVFTFVLLLSFVGSYGQLVHPGGWFLADDLNLIRTKVAAGEEPWKSGWDAAKNNGPDKNYVATVSPLITNRSALSSQGHAAYVLTIKWVVTGDQEYADTAINIINSWVETVDDIQVDQPTLTLSTAGGWIAQAAEILAHGFNGEAGWDPVKVEAAQIWLKEKVYDPWTNTGEGRSSNFGTSCVGGNMSMAVFCDNQMMLDDQINAYKFGYPDDISNGDGCAGVAQYIFSPTGQAWESGRDQAHVQGGIGHLVEAALTAWNQGVDLVSYEDYRLIAGVEYHARYNVGHDDLPWTSDIYNPCDLRLLGSSERISQDDRGFSSPMYYMCDKVFEQAGQARPNTQEVLAHPDYTPEFTNTSHPGMGTLCFIMDKNLGDPISGFDTNGLPEFNTQVLPMIEAENFDYFAEGQGNTYNDLTSSNEGNQYRINEAVDIESLASGGYNITGIQNGEWLVYTVDVPSNGTYNIDINYAAANANGTIKFNLNGTDVTSDVSVPFGSPNSTSLSDWQDFNVISDVRLSKGIQVLKVLFGGEDHVFKLNNFKVSLAQADLLIQAETYNPGTSNGIRTEDTSDVGGGLNVGHIDTGDFMEYINVDILKSGTYLLNYRVASNGEDAAIELLVDGISQGTTTIGSTGGWQDWTTLSTTVPLSEGIHTIRLNATSGRWNINWLELIFDPLGELSEADLFIQAETFIPVDNIDIRIEETQDTGGGLNVGHIDAGDFMGYHINIVNPGTYLLNYRVASRDGGGAVEFLVDGVSQGATAIASTGNWQNWITLSTTVSLSSGNHAIRLNANSGGWNINWLELIFDPSGVLSQEAFDQNNNNIRIYPNPVSDNLTVLIPISKFTEYNIFDISGRVNKQGIITNDMEKLNLDLSILAKGIYLMSLRGEQLTKTVKLIKN